MYALKKILLGEPFWDASDFLGILSRALAENAQTQFRLVDFSFCLRCPLTGQRSVDLKQTNI